jgi:hypothetical protein
MKLEDLRARKAELDSTIMQLASQWQTCQGHLAETDHWIAKMEAEALEPKPPCDVPECPLAATMDSIVE